MGKMFIHWGFIAFPRSGAHKSWLGLQNSLPLERRPGAVKSWTALALFLTFAYLGIASCLGNSARRAQVQQAGSLVRHLVRFDRQSQDLAGEKSPCTRQRS